MKMKPLVSGIAVVAMLFLNISPVFALGELPAPTPPPPVVDVCPNIDGAQSSIPTGMIIDGSGNCVTPVPADTTPPVISGIASLSLGTTEATIVWTTDEFAVSHFEYGTTTGYGTQPTLDATALLAHTAILTGLTANTIYRYCIHATDLSNNTANSCGHSFTTAANPIIVDSTPPNITLVTVAPITTTSATIGFTTSEVANAEVEYGTTAGYGSTTPLDTNLALTHSVTLSNLQSDTLYHYRIKTSDEIGNQTISSDETFTAEALSGGSVQILDTTAPVISEVGAISFGTTTATLGWTTNELATSTFEYGITTNYGTPGTLSTSALLAHTASLTGLTAGTTYYYCIHATDIAGNVTNSCGHSFSTEAISAPADITAPTISLIAAAPVTTSGSTITWTTNELANTQVNYGTTSSYGSTSNLDSILALTHSATLSNLSPNTTYHYQVRSADDAGNIALSPDQTFTTQALSGNIVVTPSDATPPVISDVGSISLDTTDATLGWTTNELATSTLEYGTTTNYGTYAILSASLLIDHTATLTGLQSGTTYYYCVHATDVAGNTANSCSHSFTTQSLSAPADTTAPVISLVASAPVTTNAATITWTTDELANSQVQYGTSASYDSATELDSILTLAHSIDITGLAPNTTYHYRVRSVDDAGNIALGSDHTFTTQLGSTNISIENSADTTAPIVSDVGRVSVGTTDATVGWTTNELATSTLRYGTMQSYGTQATLNESALLIHAGTLTGLTAGTTYYYCIHATDLAGNTTNSCGHSFATQSLSAPADTTPPVTSLIVSAPTSTAATITWTTNESASTQVTYGTSTSYGVNSVEDPILTLTHSVTLTDLSPNMTYHFQTVSTDDAGNTARSTDQTFTTGSLPQGTLNESTTNTSVMFSGIETASLATNSATISWTTDVPSDSQVAYGSDENLGSITTLDTTLTTNHSVILTGLSPNTNYIFKLKSKPVGTSLQTVSDNHEFNTLAQEIPVVAPANILSVSSSGLTTTGATISWTTDKNTTAQVEYGISTSYGDLSNENQTMETSHQIALTDLVAGTTYYYRVVSRDQASNITYSEDYTFTTPTNTSSGVESAPSAITTLAIGGYDNDSVVLVWNADSPHADINAKYDIRWNTIPMDDSNFHSGIPAQTTPILYTDLDPHGTQRTFIIAGFEFQKDLTYYFAIKSHFQNSEYSQISNVVSLKTTKGGSVNNEKNASNATTSNTTSSSSGSGGGGGGSTGWSLVNQEYGINFGGTTSASFEPTIVKAEPADNQVIFSWHNPGEANFVRTVVVRKEGSYPTSPADGQTVYEGRAETFTDINVQNGTTYYYAVYSYNHAKIYSSGVNISLAPSATNKEEIFNTSGTETSVLATDHFTKVYKKGDTDIEIEHLQEILSADGDSYAEKYISGYFGTLTEKALKNFQTKHGLVQTGIVDTATQKELNTIASSETRLDVPKDYSVFTTNIKLGDQNDAVAALQTYLIYEGSLSKENNNGVFGKSTKSAVMTFQKKYGIDPVSGYVGYKTRHKMKQLAGL